MFSPCLFFLTDRLFLALVLVSLSTYSLEASNRQQYNPGQAHTKNNGNAITDPVHGPHFAIAGKAQVYYQVIIGALNVRASSLMSFVTVQILL